MVRCFQCTSCEEVATAMAKERSNGQNNRCKISRAHICQYAFVLTALKSGQVDFKPSFAGSSS